MLPVSWKLPQGFRDRALMTSHVNVPLKFPTGGKVEGTMMVPLIVSGEACGSDGGGGQQIIADSIDGAGEPYNLAGAGVPEVERVDYLIIICVEPRTPDTQSSP